jgi:DNA-3-methyladenine glycosylase
MRPGRRLPARFFARPALDVAPELLGCWLVRTLPDGERLAARIVEVEAYLGDGSDPSSHAHPGPTARNRSMFGPPGRLYAYLSYGIHTCINVVCDAEGVGAAVLLRAAEPLVGEATMRVHRGLGASADRRRVAGGPGCLARALGLGLEHDGLALDGAALGLHRPPAGTPAPRVVAGPRIGITRAVDLPYRFHVAGDRFVSGPARARARGARSARV